MRFRRFRPFSQTVIVKPPPSPTGATALPPAKPAAAAAVAAEVPTKTESVGVQVSAFQGVKLVRAFHTDERRVEKVELSLRLDVDVRKQSVRGIVQMPHGIQSDVKLLVFCPDGEAEEMVRCGADFAGLTEMIGRIQKGWLGFDRCIATAGMMQKILPIARILGPKKLMPNPKSGTIVTDLKTAIKEVKAGGSLEFRAEDDGTMTVVIGTTNFGESQILDNLKFFVKELLKQKPKQKLTLSGAKNPVSQPGSAGFILHAALKAETGPRVSLDVEKIHPNGSGYFR